MYYPYLIISWLKRFEIPICALAELIGAQGSKWSIQSQSGHELGAGIALLCFMSLFFISPTFPMIILVSHSIFLCTDIRAPGVCLLSHWVNIVISYSCILHHFPDICVRNTLTSDLSRHKSPLSYFGNRLKFTNLQTTTDYQFHSWPHIFLFMCICKYTLACLLKYRLYDLSAGKS